MQSVSWIGFGQGGKTLFHFFPETKGVGIPHPVECKISIFTSGQSRGSLAFEGAMAGEPDGLALEQAFPDTKGSAELVGLEFEIFTEHKMDLSGSSCAVELKSGEHRCIFSPRMRQEQSFGGELLEGGESVVVVNRSSIPVAVQLTVASGGKEGLITLPETGPDSVLEHKLSVEHLPISGLGEVGKKMSAVRVKSENPQVAVYLLKKQQGEIVSVGVL